MIDVSYVDRPEHFRVANDMTVYVMRVRLRIRVYDHRLNPDNRPHYPVTVVRQALALWLKNQKETDFVVHNGAFMRVTRL